MDLLGAVSEILEPKQLERGAPLVLREDHRGNRCEPIEVRAAGEVFALRLGHDHWPRQLAQLPVERSVRKLPDYLLFAAPTKRESRSDLRLKVIVCELKSSTIGAQAALPQVRLGYLLARYLVAVAALRLGEAEPRESAVLYGGAIAVPCFIYRRGETRPGRSAQRGDGVDPLVHIPIHQVAGGGEIDVDRHCLL